MKGGGQILRKNDRYCDDDFHDIHDYQNRLLADRSPDPRHVRMIGLFSFVLHRYIVSLNTGKVLEGDRDMLIRYPLLSF